MSNDIAHREAHVALHYQSVGVKIGMGAATTRPDADFRSTTSWKLPRHCGLERLKRNVCQGRALSIQRARVPTVPHQAP